MSQALIRHNEPLEEEEIVFLSRKELRERKQFYNLIRIVMTLSFVIPFIVAWVRAFDGDEGAFSYLFYFSGVCLLLCFSGLVIFLAYNRTLRRVQADIRKQTKTIENTRIVRKQYMPHNNKYYFYLDSPNKLSIEVKERDYLRFESGDELNIEYTTHAELYLGYF